MNAKNLVVLTGRITRDIELRKTQSGVPLARFSIAVNRPKKSGEESIADFINVTAWRQSAEFASNYFHKGDAMTVIGSIQTGSYTDNEGQTRNTFEVVADQIEFPLLKSVKGSNESVSSEHTNGTPNNANGAETVNLEDSNNEDDLPF